MTNQHVLPLDHHPMSTTQGCVRAELSTEAKTIIDIHERAGGTVTVRRHGETVRWRIDGGPEMKALIASEELARRRKERPAV